MSLATKYRKTKGLIQKLRDSKVVQHTKSYASQVNDSRQVTCFECGKTMAAEAVERHLKLHHPEPKRQTTSQPTENRRKNTSKTEKKKKKNQGQSPSQGKSQQGQSSGSGSTDKNGKKIMAQPQAVENGHENPAQGIGDDIAKLMSTWADRLPATFRAAEAEAVTFDECWRGVADAFRRRAEQMVQVLNIDPSCVGPYDEAAAQASQIADAAAEVSRLINARYAAHIEVANDPNAPNPAFVKEA